MESEGTTISNLPTPSSFSARKASFSQASMTSPMPRSTKVVVEPRAPLSSTGTLAKSRSEEHTSELQSLLRTSYAVFCLKKQKKHITLNIKTYPLYTHKN